MVCLSATTIVTDPPSLSLLQKKQIRIEVNGTGGVIGRPLILFGTLSLPPVRLLVRLSGYLLVPLSAYPPVLAWFCTHCACCNTPFLFYFFICSFFISLMLVVCLSFIMYYLIAASGRDGILSILMLPR